MNNDTPTVLTNTRTRVNHHLQDDPRLRYHDFLEFDPFNTDVLTPYVEFLVETENIRDFTTLVQSLLSPSISNTNSSNLFTVTPTANKTSLGGLTVTNSTTTAQIFIILADYFSLLQDFPKSIQCLQQALILTTTAFSLSQIWLKLGLIYFQSFQKNSALVSLYTALRYNPDNLPAQYYISYVYKRNKQYLLSIMWLEKCISKNKKNIIYWLDLGDNFYSLAGGNIGSMGISNGITVASSITNGGLDKALRLYKCAISIASETNNFQYLFPLCFKIGSLLKAHSLNAEAADYFSIILDYIIPTQSDNGNENDSNMDTNNKTNKKKAQNNCYFDHPYRSILEPQQVLFLAEVRCNQGRFDIARRYLLMLIRQYELSSNQANNNAGLSNLNAGGESIAQAKAMLKRCEAAGVFE
jgi:tetratricopeptide (TPR) repeat protein